ncbi:unnamed protein product [Ambrosiozyma monospora]|uniref:Unnamed protein product n=1 Tax=Ambrosiozyma monospora TaxID=43982 RepID=A0ACB5T2Z3_AMBMO|nr:unnamed protein product [Ambrosiozyma monospora]
MAQSKMLTKLSTRTTQSLLQVSDTAKSNEGGKITIRFKTIGGSIPNLKQPVFKISRNSKFVSILKFLTKKLKLKENDGGKIYCYLGNSIVPNPDDELGNLFDLFKVGDELNISYCNMVAFG